MQSKTYNVFLIGQSKFRLEILEANSPQRGEQSVQGQQQPLLEQLKSAMWIRIWIRIHLGPRIRIQGYKMKGKAEFNQQVFVFFVGNSTFQV